MHAALGKKRTVICFLLPAVLVYAISVILPIFWSGYYSLFDWNGIGEKVFIGMQNFQELMGDQELWSSAWKTIVYTFFQVILQVGGGLLLALLLTKIVRGRNFFQTLYYIPVIISSVALCQMFKIFLPYSRSDCLISCFR